MGEVIDVKETIEDMQEMEELISKLGPEQKKIVLATVKGAVLMAECERGGNDDDPRN